MPRGSLGRCLRARRWHALPVENGDILRRSFSPFASLVQLAVSSDDPGRLICAAWAELRRPLGLVDATGMALAHAPGDDDGLRALAVAQAAARHRLVTPPGWHVVSLSSGSLRLGFLAVGGDGSPDVAARTLVDLLPTLLTDQLKRAALVRAQRAALVRELATDPYFGTDQVRGEAADLGLRLADAYWAGLLVWRNVPPAGEVIEGIERAARSRAEGALTARLQGHLILLHPETVEPAAYGAWFAAVAGEARRLAPASQAQAIVGERPVALSALRAHIAELEELLRFGPRAEEDRLVAFAWQFALDRLLLGNIDARTAATFVEERLGDLISWDRRHRSSLLTVLEAWMDFPRCDLAAAKCFMHRNTFRHHLRQAEDVLGARLEDPDSRLAVHVALKLRKMMAAQSTGRHSSAARITPYTTSGASAME